MPSGNCLLSNSHTNVRGHLGAVSWDVDVDVITMIVDSMLLKEIIIFIMFLFPDSKERTSGHKVVQMMAKKCVQ